MRGEKMRYSNLHDLINSSQSSRKYFLSLPVETQMRLHSNGELVHSAFELHSLVGTLEKYYKAVKLSEMLDRYF